MNYKLWGHQNARGIKVIYPLQVKKSRIDGKGVFSIQQIPAKKKIGDLGGDIISEKLARKRARQTRRIAIVELGNGNALDAGSNGNELRYVNHSCDPNTYMRVLYYRVEFYALKNIFPDEELTCDYGETHHEGKLECRCGTIKCRGSI